MALLMHERRNQAAGKVSDPATLSSYSAYLAPIASIHRMASTPRTSEVRH